jgi:hypothetical protein
MAAQGELGRDDLRLVPPGITFAEACHGYCWPGLLIEFYPVARGSGLHPRYLGLDRAADMPRPARSTLAFTVVDTAMRPC